MDSYSAPTLVYQGTIFVLSLSEKPAESSENKDGIGSLVRGVKSCTRQMNPSRLQVDGQVLTDEIVGSKTGLEVELKFSTQIQFTDVDGGNAGAGIHKRHPGRVGDKMIPRSDGQADHIPLLRIVLSARKELAPDFQIPRIPSVLCLHLNSLGMFCLNGD